VSSRTYEILCIIIFLASHSVSENSDGPLCARQQVAEREGGSEGRREGGREGGRETDRQKHRVEKTFVRNLPRVGRIFATLSGFSEIEIARTDRQCVLWYHGLCVLLRFVTW